jgi:hypothetical protein
MRRLTLLTCTLAVGLAAPADAHGLASPAGVPVPGFVFAWAAALVLVGSFAALGRLWPEPRLEGAPVTRRGPRVPARVVKPVCGAAGVALFAFLVARGFAGTRDPLANPLPTFVYVWFWVVLVPVCALFGDVFAAFNPWRALACAAAWGFGRLRRGRLGAPLPYPSWLGRWPAVVTIAGFAWLELASGDPANPSTLAALALGYAGVQLLGMALYGIEPWTEHGDGFAVYFGLFGRLALLVARPPLAGATRLRPLPGTVALLCVMIGATSFDGLSGTVLWRDLRPDLYDALGSQELAHTAGLLTMIAVIAIVFRLGVAGMRAAAPDHGAADLARQFVHSLIPIAAAYVVAHYVSFVVDRGLHTEIDKTVTWCIQVGALVAGHVGGLVLAHDRALVLFGDPHIARRSQQWMLTVMVGYTALGLWLLSTVAR